MWEIYKGIVSNVEKIVDSWDWARNKGMEEWSSEKILEGIAEQAMAVDAYLQSLDKKNESTSCFLRVVLKELDEARNAILCGEAGLCRDILWELKRAFEMELLEVKE